MNEEIQPAAQDFAHYNSDSASVRSADSTRHTHDGLTNTNYSMSSLKAQQKSTFRVQLKTRPQLPVATSLKTTTCSSQLATQCKLPMTRRTSTSPETHICLAVTNWRTQKESTFLVQLQVPPYREATRVFADLDILLQEEPHGMSFPKDTHTESTFEDYDVLSSDDDVPVTVHSR